MATSKAKTIDDIDDFKEMLEVMTALEISSGGLKTLDEMKSRVKSELEQLPNIPSWTAGQAFSVLSKIKEQDAKVKEFLLSFYHEVETCYDDLDDKIKTLLQKKMGDVKEKMKNHQTKMKQEDYCLLVAGETGSGKSSLINLILGEELLPYSILSTTSTICELKYGEERRIVAHYKDKDPETLLPTKTFNLIEPKASGKSYHDQIFPFVQSGREKGSVYKKVELFWPHKLLKNGVVIIDSPGVGESEIMDEIVREYLPEAFAFIYVINCTNAGGVQKDRLGKLLEGVKEKRKEEEFTSTCALFVCHKWDQVKEKKEEKKVENHVIEKLKNFYPDIVPEQQVVQMSTKNASIAQNYGIVTKRFVSLMNCMRSMVLRSVQARLEFYWRWLYGLLSQIVYHAKVHMKNTTREQEEILKLINSVSVRLSYIEEKQNEVMKDLRNHLESRTKSAVKNLSDYLCSDDIRSQFTSWTSDKVPKTESSWEVTESNITKVMENRLQEIIKRWEEDNHVFTDTRESLVRHFKERCNFLEGELRILQEALLSDEIMPQDHSETGFGLTIKDKIAIFVTSPIWVPLSLIVLVVGAPKVGVMAIMSKLEDKRRIRKYDEDKCAFMRQASTEYLNEVTKKEDVLMNFVKDQLKDAALCLKQIEARIPELIEADHSLCKQLLEEKESTKDVRDTYIPILDAASDIRGRLAVFGLEEGLAAGISSEILDLKGQSDCLGRGAFASVYRGMMKTENGDEQTVAVKIFTELLKADNACDIVDEIEFLEKLKHPNVVTFHGTSLLNKDGETRVILVMEYCKENLKNRIFSNPERAPAKSKNIDAKTDACQWIKQIFTAMSFIHDQKVVHRDLKLDNILLSATNEVKITDVGVSKDVNKITGTLAGTPVYVAPEVFHSQLYDTKADIYSLGIILWEMWYGQQAFSEFSDIPSHVALFNMVDEGLRPKHVKGCDEPPRRWKDLMESCWNKKPAERPSASHCLKEAIELHREAMEVL